MKKAYDGLFRALSSILFEADPMGIHLGDNIGEYDAEVGTILPRLQGATSEGDAQQFIYEEFCAWFGDEEVGAIENYAIIAGKVWEAWDHYLVATGPCPESGRIAAVMSELVFGMPASKLFRRLQEEDASIDARHLGEILMIEFPDISPAASLAIGRWLQPAAGPELPDEQIDGMILHYLNDAGYMQHPT